MAGAEMWHRILNAIEQLQATKPAEGRRCTKPDVSLCDGVLDRAARRLRSECPSFIARDVHSELPAHRRRVAAASLLPGAATYPGHRTTPA
jgi:hypothetical protein